MGASIQAFLANKQTYRFNAALSRMQEDGRYAMAAMARDIRMSGFAGCASRQQITVNTVADQNPPIIELDSSAIVGFDDSEGWWTQASPPQDHRGVDLTICDLAGGGGACQTSDALRVVQGSETVAMTSIDMAAPDGTIRVQDTDYESFRPAVLIADAPPISEDLVLITDCRSADLFRVQSVTATLNDRDLMPNSSLQKAYEANSIVTPLKTSSYFLADDNSDNDGDGNPDQIPALYRMSTIDGLAVPSAHPIAKGVEMMALSYGINTSGDEFADSYVTADAVPDWGNVVSVRISLLIKSIEDFITDEAVSITFIDGTLVNVGDDADRRLRLLFSSTVTLRNRVP